MDFQRYGLSHKRGYILIQDEEWFLMRSFQSGLLYIFGEMAQLLVSSDRTLSDKQMNTVWWDS